MNLTVRNVGKVRYAAVRIDGITVIAGENNSGKSTMGKALYALFHGLYAMDKKVERERDHSIQRAVAAVCEDGFVDQFIPQKSMIVITKKIIKDRSAYIDQPSKLKGEFLATDKDFGTKLKASEFDDRIAVLNNTLKVTDEEIKKSLVNRSFSGEFHGQITDISSDKKGEVCLTIKGKDITAIISDDKITDIRNGESIRTEVFYLDDPYVLDEPRDNGLFLSSYIPYLRYESIKNHRNYLADRLFSSKSGNPNVVDELVTEKLLQGIVEKLDSACSGAIENTDKHGWMYKRKDSDEYLDIMNLSSGLKSFVILKTLLMNGAIEKNGTIILDEPEIHLHPEWQLLFAEIIVLLQKEFGLHILLNTHSPYFLSAIETFSAKYGIADKCSYYLSSVDGNSAVIEDVTDDLEKVYKKLAMPLQRLETMQHEDEP